MKRMTTILVLSAGLVATPAMAGEAHRGLLTSENVGGAIGATVGGLLGSQVGDGDGQLAATAAGAVGGYIVGRDVGHNYKSGYKGGHRGGYRNERGGYRKDRGHSSRRGHDWDNDRRYSRRLQPIDKTFRARTTSNVRSGPGTRFHVIDQLHHRERVHVVGKVRGRNWLMVRTGHRRGFVYAPLLRPAHYGYRNHRGHRDHDRWRGRDNNRWHR